MAHSKADITTRRDMLCAQMDTVMLSTPLWRRHFVARKVAVVVCRIKAGFRSTVVCTSAAAAASAATAARPAARPAAKPAVRPAARPAATSAAVSCAAVLLLAED